MYCLSKLDLSQINLPRTVHSNSIKLEQELQKGLIWQVKMQGWSCGQGGHTTLARIDYFDFFCLTVSITFIFPSSVYYCQLLFKLFLYIYFGQILFYKIDLWQYLNCCSCFSATTCSLSCSLFSLSNFACSFIFTSLCCAFSSSSAFTSARCLLSSASRKARSLWWKHFKKG